MASAPNLLCDSIAGPSSIGEERGKPLYRAMPGALTFFRRLIFRPAKCSTPYEYGRHHSPREKQRRRCLSALPMLRRYHSSATTAVMAYHAPPCHARNDVTFTISAISGESLDEMCGRARRVSPCPHNAPHDIAEVMGIAEAYFDAILSRSSVFSYTPQK